MNIGEKVSIVAGRSKNQAIVCSANTRYIRVKTVKGSVERVFGAKTLKERGGEAKLVALST